MPTNQPQSPQALPTVEEVKAFMEHWGDKIVAFSQSLNPKPYYCYFSASSGALNGGGTEFRASLGIPADVTVSVDDPEKLIQGLIEATGPSALAAKVAALRAEADELERSLS